MPLALIEQLALPTGSFATFCVATKCFAFLGLAAALLGCRSGPAPDIVSPTATPPTDWFCEATGAGWDCAEAEDGKAVPRSPPVQSRPQAGDAERSGGGDPLPVVANPGEEGVRAAPEREEQPEPVREASPRTAERAQPSASGLASLHRDASAEPMRRAAPVVAGAVGLPDYLRLAYRPDREVAFTELPDEFYAVQLLALGSPEAVETFVADAGVPGLAAARVERDGRLFYVLLLGIYRDHADATQAAAASPAELSHLTPWIRPLRTLKAAMLRADDLAARQGGLEGTRQR